MFEAGVVLLSRLLCVRTLPVPTHVSPSHVTLHTWVLLLESPTRCIIRQFVGLFDVGLSGPDLCRDEPACSDSDSLTFLFAALFVSM